MALFKQNQIIQQSLGKETRELKEVEEKTKPSLGRTLKAAFQQENIIGSYLANGFTDKTISDPNYDPIDTIIGTPYEADAQSFVYADSDEEVRLVKERIDREKENRRILKESGWVGVVSAMAAGVLDPTILIPGTAAVKAVTTGVRVAKGAVIGSALTSSAVGTQEAFLHRTQATRTANESLFAIGAAGILGGAMGGAISFLAKPVAKGVTKEIQTMISGDMPKAVPLDRSVGAASFVLDPAEEGLARIGKVGGIGEKLVRHSTPFVKTPVTEGLTSNSPLMRKFTNDFFQHNFILGKNLKGQASPVSIESLMKIDQAKVATIQRQGRNAYHKYAGLERSVLKGLKSDIGALTPQNKLTYAQFQDEVGKAMRRGDKHEVAEIQEVAQIYRKEVNNVARELQELDLLPSNLDVKTAESYLSRRYNVSRIIQERDKFNDIITNYLQRTNKNLADPLEASAKADDIIDNIIGLGDQSLGMTDIATRISTKATKSTKQRVFHIPDEEIEAFLDSNADQIVSSYMYQGNAVVRFNKYLRDSGFESAADMKQAMKAELDTMIKANPKDAVKLTKEFGKNAKLLDDDIAILLGHFGRNSKNSTFGKGLQLLRKYQVTRLLGGVTLSSQPDLMMPVLRHGLPRSISNGFSQLARTIKGSKMNKLSAEELKRLGIGLELENNDMLRMMIDSSYSPPIYGSSVLDRMLKVGDVISDKFNKISLMAYWNNGHRRFAGRLSTNRTFKAIMADKANKKEVFRLRELGIDEGMQKRIKVMLRKYGQHEDGLSLSNMDRWSDVEAAETLGSSIIKETDATILLPGRGDIPRIVQEHELGKSLFQFKSFIATATNKILIRGLQQRDANTLLGIVGLIGMGYWTYATKAAIAGREIKDDPQTILLEGISRSGVAGLFGDLAIGSVWNTSRYAGTNLQSMFLGPSANLISDTYNAARGPLDGDLSDRDIKNLGRTLPLQNLFYLRLLLQQLGED